MSEHETPKGLDGELEELLGAKEVARKILQGCRRYQESARGGWPSRMPAQHEPLSPELSAAYDSVLDRAEDFVRRAASLPPHEGVRFQKALSLLRSGEGVDALTSGGMSLKGLGIYEALLARSWAIRYDNPREMCHLAKVAMEISEDFDPDLHGRERVADLQARAWGELANAYRVADRLREAEQAFGLAFARAKQGSGDRCVMMRLLDLQASLLGTRREFKLALQSLTILSNLYREAGEEQLAGRALVTKALYTFYDGNTKEACQTLVTALELIDEDRDPALALVASFNQILFLVDDGRYREAKKALFRKRAKLIYPGRIAQLKLRGIEGRISYGLGEIASAEIAFREAKAGFEEASMVFACALAGLDLAMTLMRQARTEEAIQEGLASADAFLSIGVHREIFGMVILLQQALLDRTADLTLLESTARYLRKKMMELGLG